MIGGIKMKLKAYVIYVPADIKLSALKSDEEGYIRDKLLDCIIDDAVEVYEISSPKNSKHYSTDWEEC